MRRGLVCWEAPKTLTVRGGRRSRRERAGAWICRRRFAEEDVAAAGLEIKRNLAESAKLPKSLDTDELRMKGRAFSVGAGG